MSSIRIRTTPNESDSYINVDLSQKFDFIEILSLTLRQEDVYRRFCSDYGVVVGRVTVNTGFGVPNAKVSIFIPIDDVDIENDEIFGLYPYEEVLNKNSDGLRYNLLPNTNETKDSCNDPIGSFPNKREVLDNDDLTYVYCKYYKFTTTTNSSGDFMFFGVPVGAYQLHVDADISNIGIISQKPYDLIREGYNDKMFESPSKYKSSNNLDTLAQLKTKTPIGVNVQPFWGDTEQCQAGITRMDIDLATNITPHAIFIGSIFSDNEKNSINKNCRPRKNLGELQDLITGPGRVEMIRKTPSGETERFDVLGGEVIDEDGTWAYQVPMNLDYVYTDEFGNLVPTDDPNKGIPTRAKVRFRVKMTTTGSEGRLRTRASYLIPHNPSVNAQSDYTFDERTRDDSFADLYWNKIYTVSNHITRVQRICNDTVTCSTNRNFLGIKNVDEGENTLFPFNRMTVSGSPLFPLFSIICIILSIVSGIVWFINKIVGFINNIVDAINSVPGVNIDFIGFVLLSCNEDEYCIGCNINNPGYAATEENIADPDNNKWLNCQTTQLIDGFDILKFDFYNDWINGTLYSYLLKYKIKKKGKGKERFCDYECEDNENGVDNNEDGVSDNKCRSLAFVDTCTSANPQNYSVNNPVLNAVNSLISNKTKGGLIKKDVQSGELYYAAISKNDVKLYATKIVNLGSALDCDWQGVPKIYNFLVETTYNIPPLSPEYYEDPNEVFYDDIETSGFDTPGGSLTGALIAKIRCFSIETKSDNCNNIRRLCELGMGLDEDRRDPDTNTGSAVDNKITNIEIENPFVRGAFAFLNYPTTPPQTIPLVYIDAGSGINYQDQYYKVFRGYDSLFNQNSKLWFFKNSFYFYFGLKPGRTALQKLLTNYFPECVKSESNDLKIVIENIIDDNITGVGTGQITFKVGGGVGSYTYQWLGPSINGLQYQCPDPNGTTSQPNCGNGDGSTFTLQNLIGGQYTLIVTDSGGLQTSTTVNLNGLAPVQCNVLPTPADANGNGKVSIFINGGIAPYTIQIQGISNTSYNVQLTTSSLTYCYGNCTGPSDLPNIVNQLPVGEYLITVIDSGVQAVIGGQTTVITTQCTSNVLISQPLNIDVNVTTVDAPCYGSNGGGTLAISGGIAPYSITWVMSSTNNPSNQSLVGNIISTSLQPIDLPSGNYNITVTDLAGNIETISAIIDEPQPILIQNLITNAPGCYFSASGGIKFNINGQNPPYNVDISGPISQFITTNDGVVNIDGFEANQNNSQYTILISDSTNCEITQNVTIPFPQYGQLYVRTLSKTWTDINGNSVSRVIVRFKGGHGGPYHFRVNGNSWVNLGNPYNQTLPGINYNTTIVPDFQVYQSTTMVNNEPTFEFQMRASTATNGAATFYPYNFDYFISDKGQQGTYAMFRGKAGVSNTGTNLNSNDSNFGTTSPYGCYSYKNNNGTPVSGQNPQGVLLTQPI
jgi:hypothetical protein